ncbi:hypothetical protein BDN71DRAFT_809486 [Pleurotus eryngii]|uniref:Uncharacterized protein n=1 Tax=Pleurotus eryngii TaxID=5323 RepID=A0A9P6A0E0_PLEER|nr:hypothetical protein BDN71DRAFT_809486 [Pleurotus eryngii]
MKRAEQGNKLRQQHIKQAQQAHEAQKPRERPHQIHIFYLPLNFHFHFGFHVCVSCVFQARFFLSHCSAGIGIDIDIVRRQPLIIVAVYANSRWTRRRREYGERGRRTRR